MDLKVSEVTQILHRTMNLGLVQTCPSCGKEYATLEFCVQFFFNELSERAYMLARECERPLVCCGKEIALIASFDTRESADTVMLGYAQLCVGLGQSSFGAKSPVDTVIPCFPAAEVISALQNSFRNPSP